MIHDLLRPCATLCKALQNGDICTITAISSLVKAAKSIDELKTIDFAELPTVKKVLTRLHHEAAETTYQGVKITKYNRSVEYLKLQKTFF